MNIASTYRAPDAAAQRNERVNGVIVTNNLTRTYQMGDTHIHALQGVNLTISRGDYVAIMGPSGSGKSTLMNIIGCLDSPDAGSYELNGTLVSELGDRQLALVRNQEIGFVFQTFNLLQRTTALHNVEMPLIYAGIGRRQRLKTATAVINTVGLADRMHHKPSELSGGQRQRVAIARALVTKPSILLADEPTGNLDSTTAKEIMELFEELHKAGNTIVLVTHDGDVANNADRIVSLLDGKIETDTRTSE